jgi:hypothetical protein
MDPRLDIVHVRQVIHQLAKIVAVLVGICL